MLHQPLDVTFLIDHDQDLLYEVRDHCRGVILAGKEASEDIALWMQEHCTERFAHHHHLNALGEKDWLSLAESCLADTQEVMGYEEAHGLSVKP
jgi:hypothetical protein